MKRFLSMVGGLVLATAAMAQTIILFPDDSWMKMHNYGKSVANAAGRSRWVADYQLAFENEGKDNTDISTALTTTSSVLTSQGFHVEDIKASMGSNDQSASDADELGFDNSGTSEQVIPDFRVNVFWQEVPGSRMGRLAEWKIKFQATDNFTGDAIAAIDVATAPTAEQLNKVIQRVIADNVVTFSNKIREYHDKTKQYGRQIKVVIGARGGLNFNEEQVNGQAMKYYLKEAVGACGKYLNVKTDKANYQQYRVRIPLGTKIDRVQQQLESKFSSELGQPVETKVTGVGSLSIAIGAR